MRNGLLQLTLVLTAFAGLPAAGQMDPSTALLLRRPSAAAPLDPAPEMLSEDVYTVRPIRAPARPKPVIVITPAATEPVRSPAAPLVTVGPRAPAAEDAVGSSVGEMLWSCGSPVGT